MTRLRFGEYESRSVQRVMAYINKPIHGDNDIVSGFEGLLREEAAKEADRDLALV